VTLPVTRGLEVSAIGNFMSGAPFTPIVGSDINGDGAKNDRAFIFNPARTADTAIANGMQALLAAAPSPIRSCLRRQLGGIAGRNSCTGPWQASLDLQVNWRPEWFGLARRLTMSLLTVNLLGGLDEWLHGPAQLRGWGSATAPHPNPIITILGLPESLACTPDQVAQLQAIADPPDARNRLLPESLAAAVRAAVARDDTTWALELARAALTPEHWSKVPTALK